MRGWDGWEEGRLVLLVVAEALLCLAVLGRRYPGAILFWEQLNRRRKRGREGQVGRSRSRGSRLNSGSGSVSTSAQLSSLPEMEARVFVVSSY
ncbi:hypothetical protein BKA80DRAFT_267658 [Phyllosticta citrichinensis]